jgi:hypothetical protein
MSASDLEQELELARLKLQKLEQLEREAEVRRKLPHRYMHKFYPWAREFFDDWKHRKQVLNAANQLGKSSTCIKKLIECAISPETWRERWPELPAGQKPAQWWYLYPTREICHLEFEEKWRPLLPKYPEDHPQYGWKYTKQKADGGCISFNTGINIYFKAYAQGATNLQGSSVYVCACDEEVVVDVLPELQMRVNATNGYMFFVFTATLGQDFWRRVVEERSKWPDARVWQIGLYDSQKYEDGTPSAWTDAKIRATIDACANEAQVQNRVHGKFVVEEEAGRRVPTFDPDLHLIPYRRLEAGDYFYYAGLDYGSGSRSGHPSAITITAIHKSMRHGYITHHWRGDDIETTCEDVIRKFVDMRASCANFVTGRYDFSARDMGTIAARMGMPLEQAMKSVESGANVVSVLFKRNALLLMTPNEQSRRDGIPDDHMQQAKLSSEMVKLRVGANKRTHHTENDDSYDSARYCIVSMPWAFDQLEAAPKAETAKVEAPKKDERLAYYDGDGIEPPDGVEEEMDEWAELMNS